MASFDSKALIVQHFRSSPPGQLPANIFKLRVKIVTICAIIFFEHAADLKISFGSSEVKKTLIARAIRKYTKNFNKNTLQQKLYSSKNNVCPYSRKFVFFQSISFDLKVTIPSIKSLSERRFVNSLISSFFIAFWTKY